jgi:prepilin-type N-terminal cleavage/methylation domain-containing protein
MSKQNLKAFTLIEVMLVVGIISVISGISWVALSKSKKNVDALNACTQVAAYINKTRNYVISGRANQATVNIAIDTIFITGNDDIKETYKLKGGVDCGNNMFSYSAPNGDGGIAKTINCVSSDGMTKSVSVTPYQAVCK